jgi:isopentenyl-diphosphate delta-isomerase
MLMANLGAVQLNYGFSLESCKELVNLAEADALILHLNPLQEALQPDGNTDFSGLLHKIECLCIELQVPVIVKEVGWGISGTTAKRLLNAGVSAIDVAGAGGTSWSQVEMYRAQDESQAGIASGFRGWGISTAQSIIQVRKADPDILIFASGGIKDGIEVAKCVALGASICGTAGKLLKPATKSSEDVEILLAEMIKQLKITMFAAGAADLASLRKLPLIEY